jgi:hypothetical protein
MQPSHFNLGADAAVGAAVRSASVEPKNQPESVVEFWRF